MAVTVDGLGGIWNVVQVGSGKHINMKHGTAVTYTCFRDAGDQVITLRESIDGASEQLLPILDTLYKAPGVGGTWTKVTQTASATYTHADATDDCLVFTIYADQLSDGFDSIEVTVSAGTCQATIHGLYHARAPERLVNPVT